MAAAMQPMAAMQPLTFEDLRHPIDFIRFDRIQIQLPGAIVEGRVREVNSGDFLDDNDFGLPPGFTSIELDEIVKIQGDDAFMAHPTHFARAKNFIQNGLHAIATAPRLTLVSGAPGVPHLTLGPILDIVSVGKAQVIADNFKRRHMFDMLTESLAQNSQRFNPDEIRTIRSFNPVERPVPKFGGQRSKKRKPRRFRGAKNSYGGARSRRRA
jgi:hypothetical protein